MLCVWCVLGNCETDSEYTVIAPVYYSIWKGSVFSKLCLYNYILLGNSLIAVYTPVCCLQALLLEIKLCQYCQVYIITAKCIT